MSNLSDADQLRLGDALREASQLSVALLGAQSLSDVRQLAVTGGVLLGGGGSAVLTHDPLLPRLRIDASAGPLRGRPGGFAVEISDSFPAEAFAFEGGRLPAAVGEALGLSAPVVVPLGQPTRVRGLWTAELSAPSALAPLMAAVLRQFGAVVNGALLAAEARASADRVGELDAVTSLPNRRAAETLLRRELARARRYREPLSMVLIDLDRFGELNDHRGYQAGDRVLKEIGRLLTGFPSTARELTGFALCFRESDLAARAGADSFLVILPATAREGARLAADRFLAGLRQHRVPLDADSVAVTATAAVVSFPEDGDGADQLTVLSNRLVADAAQAGGNRLVLSSARPGTIAPLSI